MEKKILGLGSNGKLVVKSVGGKEQAVSSGFPTATGNKAIAFLLIDASGSMFGERIVQAKQGILDFARTAIKKGYLVGLVKFDSSAALLCEPTVSLSWIQLKVEELEASGGTLLAPALTIASQRLLRSRQYRVIVVGTDGCPSDPLEALRIAERLKQDGVEILAIGTDGANWEFLSKLVSRKDLNLRVEGNQFRKGMDTLARKLPTHLLEDKT